jgi:CTP:phosphocholine cytidylyltransferase-like protein
MNKPEIAILMAAGMGSRMRPITSKQPKPLVKVNNIPIIETIIEGLRQIDIKEIYIVTGYLGEQFSYLTKKYNNITLIENREYSYKNNISSIYAVNNILGTANCFICEADLLVYDSSIFKREYSHSQYMARMMNEDTNDWSFRLNNDRIIKITQGGCGVYNMVGISFWTKEDATRIRNATIAAYERPNHEQLYWDEIVDLELSNMYVGVQPVTEQQIVEIDTVTELQALDSSYMDLTPYL